MPQTLRAAVLEAWAKKPKERTSEDQAVLLQQQHVEVAAFLTDVWNPDTQEWEPETFTAEELDSGYFPRKDLDALLDIVLGERNAAQVTADSELALGKIDIKEWASVQEKEAGATVNGWRQFRDWLRGLNGDAQRADVEGAPEQPAPDNRAARRARSRRRAGTAAGAGAG